MKIKKALIVYKKSNYQDLVLEKRSVYYVRLVKQGDPSVRDWPRVHEEHMAALGQVKRALKQAGIPFRTISRTALKGPSKADLTISVGGDGTFLEASHYVTSGLMLGVNSTPLDSVGFFAASFADNFPEVIEKLLAGRAKIWELQRLQAFVGGRRCGPPALNEILFASINPGATSRYRIRCRKGDKKKTPDEEEQKSSGVWIATASGSSAALRSAGGHQLPLKAEKLSFQVRELYVKAGERYRLKRGIIRSSERLSIIPKMNDAALFIDGPREVYPVKRGKVVTFQLSRNPLRVVR